MFPKKTSALFVWLLFFLFGFSILTDDDGRYRTYRNVNLPFEYKVHNSATEDEISEIQKGANSWNKIKGCYFQFSYAGQTSKDTVAQDETNLVYFDYNYDNFTPNSSVIAFSSTFTLGYSTPAYRAVESDLIYNAADFPPALNLDGVDSDKQDLQGTVAHEFGHHIGLGHAGEAGSPPGLGQDIPEATMYGTGPPGDTTARSLHIDDIAGAIALYPRWNLDGYVVDADSNTVITDFLFSLNGAYSPIVGSSAFKTVWQRAGRAELNAIEITDTKGHFDLISINDSLNITIQAFGYESLDTLISLGDSSSVNSTLSVTFPLKLKPKNHIHLKFVDQSKLDTVHADVKISLIGESTANKLINASTNINKELSLDLPSGQYALEISPELPYALLTIDSINIFSDTLIVFDVIKADYLLVDDDYSLEMDERHDKEEFYLNFFNLKNIESYAYRNLDVVTLAELEKLEEVSFLIWFTGDNTNALNNYTSLLKSYLQSGGKLLLTGNSYISTLDDSLFLKEMFNLEFAGFNTGQVLQGEADDPIGQNEFIGIAHASPEKMKILDYAEASKVFTYYRQPEQGAIKYDGLYKAVVYSFGIDAILENYNPTGVLERTIDWLNQPTGLVGTQSFRPEKFSLGQNYPNPFNPITEIEFTLRTAKAVTLVVYNTIGQKVAVLINKQKMNKGSNKVTFDATGFSSGVYYYSIEAGNFTSIKKMVLIK